jgi:hypothetical protein
MATRLPNTTGASLTCWSVSAILSLGFASGCLDERGLAPNKLTILPSEGGEAGALGTSGSEAGSGGDTDGGDGTMGGIAGSGTPVAVGGSGGNGGSSGNAGPGEAGSDGIPHGGMGGAGGSCGCSGSAGTPIDLRCPDLDGNGVLDCDETLVKNASFDEDATGWSLETGSELAWEDKDGWDHDDSGSLGVTNQVVETIEGNALTGARQCFPVSGGTVYTFAVQISMPDYAGDTKAGMQLNLFDNAACAGNLLDHPTTNWVKGSAWNVAQITYLTPPKAKSAMLRLVAMKPFRQTPVAVLFDNVLGHTE